MVGFFELTMVVVREREVFLEWESDQNYSLDRGYKLFMNKNELEVIRVSYSITSILSFKINVLLSSKSV